LKHFFLTLVAKLNAFSNLALAKLGFWGIAVIALIDSSSLPVPMDLLIGGAVWKQPGRLLIFCVMGAVGSAIGGLVPYGLGRAGGELFLLKRVNRERFESMRHRFERQEFLAVLVPSMLPPPTPWKAFVFAAGVFEMRIVPFMVAVFFGRLIRWVALSLLVIKLGPSAVDLVGGMVKDHLGVFLGVVVLIFASIALWAVMKRRRRGRGSNDSGIASVEESGGDGVSGE
jgi:membrane protein YqaA with SNARE-associated domain